MTANAVGAKALFLMLIILFDMKKLRGQKLNMTQIFDQSGKVTPVTLVKLEQPMPESFDKGASFAKVTAFSKGKGFAGVMKRWHFAGGPATHGQSNKQRSPGSIGSSMGAVGHVLKGKRMAGHMGVDKVTLKNKLVHEISDDRLLIAVDGPLPGHFKSELTLYFEYED